LQKIYTVYADFSSFLQFHLPLSQEFTLHPHSVVLILITQAITANH